MEGGTLPLLNEFSAEFDEIADPYFRERKGDVADLIGRLTMNLRHGVATRDLLRALDDPSILIADELTPSLAAQVDWTKVRGFATDAGSQTYHTAILARSLEVPAVVGLHEASRLVQAGQLVVLDGDAHELILDPDAETLARAERRAEDRPPPRGTEGEPRGPAVTRDGVRIHLEANIEFPDDLAAARYAGAEGIGLYRSEFLLTGAAADASEDEQYDVYRSMLEGMAPGTVTVRTFDVDEEGDYELYINNPRQRSDLIRYLRSELDPPAVIVLTNEWFGHRSSFDKINQWPSFAGYLRDNYQLVIARSFAEQPGRLYRTQSTDHAYRIYLRKGVALPLPADSEEQLGTRF